MSAKKPSNPYRELCDLALMTHEAEGKRFSAQKGKPEWPHKWGDEFRELESKVRSLKDAGLVAADATGFPIMEVKRWVNAAGRCGSQLGIVATGRASVHSGRAFGGT